MTKIRPNTYDAIVEAAFQLLNRQPGATLEDIAKLAGVGRATLHRHFSSRDDLMAALAKTATSELNEAVEAAVANAATHTEGLRLALEAMIPLANRQWFLVHQEMAEDETAGSEHQKDMAELRASIEEAKCEGTFDPNVPTAWILEAYLGLIYTAWTMVRDDELTAKQASELAWRTLESGLKGQNHDD